MEQKENTLFWRLWFYFRRGHGNYLSFIVSLCTFVVVVYQLAIKNVPFLEQLFPNMWIFIIVFGVIYLVVTVLVGWQDMKRGSYLTESTITFDKHPRFKEQYDATMRIEKRLDDIEKELAKQKKARK
jgi:hypothetical protein